MSGKVGFEYFDDRQRSSPHDDSDQENDIMQQKLAVLELQLKFAPEHRLFVQDSMQTTNKISCSQRAPLAEGARLAEGACLTIVMNAMTSAKEAPLVFVMTTVKRSGVTPAVNTLSPPLDRDMYDNSLDDCRRSPTRNRNEDTSAACVI